MSVLVTAFYAITIDLFTVCIYADGWISLSPNGFFYMRQTVAQSLQLIAIEDGPETGASMFNSPHLQNA